MARKLTITYRPVEELIPYARNARTHSDEQVLQIAASIKEYGFTNPVLIDGDNGIIAGHGRVMAARRLKMTEVPTVVLSDMTEAQRRAYILADNKLALNAGWDADLLKIEIADLNALDYDLTLTGFSLDELNKLLGDEPGLTDPDDVPETPNNPVSQIGDVWVLGSHRLVCGDSTNADDVAKALNGVKPHLMVTDPPYGVEYDAEWRGKAKNADGTQLSTGKGRAKGKVVNDDKADWREAWALFPGDVVYVWHAMMTATTVAQSLMETGFEVRAEIVWAKSSFVVSRGHYHPQHESCWYAVRKGKTGSWGGDRKQSTVWQIDKPKKSETGHSTQKPVECMKRPIENNSSAGQAVYEPFSGSGTTIIACETTGRACHAIELNPAYVDVTILRWQEFTGNHAILEADGRTFTELLGERQPFNLIHGKKAAK